MAAPLGLPTDKEFDPKTALLLLSSQDDEEDIELVDGPIEYVEARSTPLTNRRYEVRNKRTVFFSMAKDVFIT